MSLTIFLPLIVVWNQDKECKLVTYSKLFPSLFMVHWASESLRLTHYGQGRGQQIEGK